ncbi:c-type cytochrome [Roseovarius salinarum]|uniref:c-type cytochrome n=1 Tax=Roseovarius salinarum TaxID=1981892 RepID=UPI000C342B9E|nr:cytochrome c [Roseovarius salinarum]
MVIKPIAAVAAVAVAAGSASAEEVTLGEAEYMNSCAQCHGEAGDGNGVMAAFMTTAPPDLRMLQKENGGVFPVERVRDVIRNSVDVGPHGTSEMPAWGQRYTGRAIQEFGPLHLGSKNRAYVETRILALVEYLSTLQEN